MACSPVEQEHAECHWSDSTDADSHLRSCRGRISSVRGEGASPFSRSFCPKNHGHVPHGGTARSPPAACPHLGPACQRVSGGDTTPQTQTPVRSREGCCSLPAAGGGEPPAGSALRRSQEPSFQASGARGQEVACSDQHWSRLSLCVFTTRTLWAPSFLLSIQTEGLIDIPKLSRAE